MPQNYRYEMIIRVVVLAALVTQSFQEYGQVAPGVPPVNYQTQTLDAPSINGNIQQNNNYHESALAGNTQQEHISNGEAHHAHQHQTNNVFDGGNILSERDHLQEHMDIPIDTSKMTSRELAFYYYKVFDFDKNNKLDGLELIKSLIHEHEQEHDNDEQNGNNGTKVIVDSELAEVIDFALQVQDKDGDGMIDFGEFLNAQAQLEASNAKKKPK